MANKKILIVDDDAKILALLDNILSGEGYQVIEAGGGKDAVDKIKEASPQLIIMDIMMPDMYGSDVVTVINEDPAIKDIPIIFISGLAGDLDDEIIKAGLKVDGRQYTVIAKPFQSQDILGEVKNALG